MRPLALLLAVPLAACGGGDTPDVPTEATGVPKAAPLATASGQAIESEYGTPVKDRSATLGLLNKRNNLTQDIVLKSGESKRVGNVIVKMETCERTLPWEKPEEEGAFVQVLTYDRTSPSENLQWRRVFSGWLFRNSPSLNVVEHPVYDVWIKNCAMRFPGEEARPESSASASAAKPSGTPSPKAAPAPTPTPTPTPSPSSSPSPSSTRPVA